MLIQKLWENSYYFKNGLKELGFDIGKSETPITPVIGLETSTIAFSKALLEQRCLCSPIIYPTVPEGTGRLRCMLSASHTTEDLDKALKL